jgi:phosphoadenosine phosphosulfate reductase
MDTSPWDAARIAEANRLLEDAPPEAILRWASRTFQPRLMMATAFGVEGCVIMHMLAEIDPSVRVINLDTGYQFAETLEVRDKVREKYGIDVELVSADQSVAEYEAEHGGPLYVHRPDQCCFDRKMVPLKKAVVGYDAWLSSIRAEQSKDRAVAKPVEWDRKFGLVKVNPILGWTRSQVWGYALKNGVPYNVLHDRNYPSIGCWPCTRPVEPGQDERAGRWAGSAKKECGLHVVQHEAGSGI